MRTFPLEDIPHSSASFPELKGRVALVTGGERGIGQGIATFLGRQGMRIAIVGKSPDEGQRAVRQFNEADIEAVWIESDVSIAGAAGGAVVEVMDRLGDIDLLVNNAAAQRTTDFLEYDDETYELSFEKNVRMVYRMSREAGRLMARRRGGVIINISSVGGLRAHRRQVGYDASKGAIDAMTRAVSLELAPHGIRVNAVAPGAIINRPVTEQARPHREQQAAGIPLGRVGNVTDIGGVVGFLASDLASYITGQTIYVDGGLTTQLTPPGIYI